MEDGEATYVIHKDCADGLALLAKACLAGNEVEKKKAAPGTALYEELWCSFFEAFVPFLRERGWVKDVYFAFDERHPKEMVAALKMLDSHLPEDFKPLQTSSAYEYNEKYTDLITDLSPGFNPRVDWNDIAARRRSRGQRTTFYLCEHERPPKLNTLMGSQPEESRWIGWYAAAAGLDGFLRWAYDSWPSDPLLCADFLGPHGHWPAGDTFLCYPHGWSSKRLANMRAGIQDYEKLRLLTLTGLMNRAQLSSLVFKDSASLPEIASWVGSLDRLSVTHGLTAGDTIYIVRHGDRFDIHRNNNWKTKMC